LVRKTAALGLTLATLLVAAAVRADLGRGAGRRCLGRRRRAGPRARRAGRGTRGRGGVWAVWASRRRGAAAAAAPWGHARGEDAAARPQSQRRRPRGQLRRAARGRGAARAAGAAGARGGNGARVAGGPAQGGRARRRGRSPRAQPAAARHSTTAKTVRAAMMMVSTGAGGGRAGRARASASLRHGPRRGAGDSGPPAPRRRRRCALQASHRVARRRVEGCAGQGRSGPDAKGILSQRE
jgi:hypothetical protein